MVAGATVPRLAVRRASTEPSLGYVVPALLPAAGLALGARLGPPPSETPVLRLAERVGDGLLAIGAAGLLQLFRAGVEPLFVGGGFGPSGLRFKADTPREAIVALAVVSFVVFYLPPRLLHLLEDGRRLRTWLGVLLAVLPLAMHAALAGSRTPL